MGESLSPEHGRMIRYLYTIPGWSPLEIANELGLTFRQVCHHIDKHCLRKLDTRIAVLVRKATRADAFEALDMGFHNPFVL